MTYSTLITWLKVILPLIALGLLSTVFLFARSVPEEAQLPYIEDLRKRTDAGDGMRSSFYTGSTEGGDAVTVEASSVLADPSDPDRTLARDLIARIGYTDGSDVVVVSKDGTFSDIENSLLLTGDVVITTSSGYVMQTDELFAEMDAGRATSPGSVDVEGPPGTLTAGGMVLTREDDAEQSTHLFFTNGVKLVYQREKDTK